MKSNIRIFITDSKNQRFFGEGPYKLLLGIEKTGSLRKSALSMGMAYTKAQSIMHTAEKSLGYPITTKQIGGKGGGGSTLTNEAKEFIKKYERYKYLCNKFCEQTFDEMFSEQQ